MNAPKWTRQFHRWISILFTLTVIANFAFMAARGGAQPPMVVVYSPLPPLFLLIYTGLYLFALPFRKKSRVASLA
ncbi:MAG: hypothetical protein ABI852_20410 [Gemmatimonadaceae bacterium]